MISDFHFLRPLILLALFLPALLAWLAHRSANVRGQWKEMIAPHLLDRLVIDAAGQSLLRPSWFLVSLLVFAITGAAGPTMTREAPPFVEDTAPLVIAVDLSQTMDAIDVAPSRLERAKLKIKDVVAARNGARTAMIAYAGDAHLVLPLTEDAALLESYSDALETRIMPTPGRNTDAALSMAGELLAKETARGTILLITDGVEPTASEALKSQDNGVIILGVGTAAGGPVKSADGSFLADASGGRIFAKLDVAGLKALGSETGADVATITDDDTDVRWIAQRIQSNFSRKQAAEGDRWYDLGWWLVIPAALLSALSFRKGWVFQAGALLVAIRFLTPDIASAQGLQDMWLTQDQQGRVAYQRGDFEAASALFSDPMWKAAALYRAGRYAEAVDALAPVDTAESWYDQGNALLHLSKFDEAVVAYHKALATRKGWPDAQANLAIAEQLSKAKKEKEDDQPQDPNQKADSVQFDDKGKQGKQGQMNIAEQTSEMWMKNINASPTDLMARKFAIEAGRRSQ